MKFKVTLHITPRNNVPVPALGQVVTWEDEIRTALELIPGVDEAKVEPDRPGPGIGEQ